MKRKMFGLLGTAWLSLVGCSTSVASNAPAADAGAEVAADVAVADVAAIDVGADIATVDSLPDLVGDAPKDAAPPPVDAVTPDAAPPDAVQADAADVGAPADVAADAPDTVQPFVCCKDDASCGPDLLCFEGKACVSSKLSLGECWHSSDCGPGQACQGAYVCPCNADCFAVDKPGTCAGGPGGCCSDAKGCASGSTCAGGGTNKICKSQAELSPGGCWADADCMGGTCKGANVCPCGAMCLVADKQGSCGAGACTTVDPNSFGACDMIVGVVFDGKACVYASGCGCGKACASVFKDLSSCQVACGMQ